MGEHIVVPDDLDEPGSGGPQGPRRSAGVLLAAAVVAGSGLAVLFSGGGSPTVPTDLTGPLPELTTTTAPEPSPPSLGDAWIPTWLPGSGELAAVASGPAGTVAMQSNGWSRVTAWHAVQPGVWERGASFSGWVTDVVVGTEGVVAVGFDGEEAFEGEPRPVVWWSRGGSGPWERVDLSDRGVVAAVVAGPDGFVAVGWEGATSLGMSQIDVLVGGAGAEPRVWRSRDGRSWVPAEVDTEGSAWLASVAQVEGRLVAGGRMARRARLWTSTDGGRSWRRVGDDPRKWPGSETFTSIAAVADTALAVSVRDGDPVVGTMWRAGPDGWQPFEPDGLISGLVERVVAVDGGVVALSPGSFGGSGRGWISSDGLAWNPVSFRFPGVPAGVDAPVRIVDVADTPLGPVFGGSAGRQPVLWTPERRVRLAYEVGAEWERLEPGFSDWVVYFSDELTILQGDRKVTVVAATSPLAPAWEPEPPSSLFEVTKIAGSWWASGWRPGGEIGVWSSTDGVFWRLVATGPGDTGVQPLVWETGAGVMIAGRGFSEALEAPGIGVVDVGDATAMTELDGRLVTIRPEGDGSWTLHRDGGPTIEIPDTLFPQGLYGVGRRLLLVAFDIQRDGRARMVAYDTDLRVVGEVDSPVPTWAIGGVGDRLIAPDPRREVLWWSDDGEEWASIPMDPSVGITGSVISAVRTDGRLVLQGLDQGRLTLWRWTGSLPRGDAP